MANPGSLITTRAHGIDTYVDEYPRDNSNRLLVPAYEDLPGQVDFVAVQIYQGGYWRDFPAVWANLASPCPIRGVYVYQLSSESWEKQASETLGLLPSDCQFIALDIEKIGNTVDKTFLADAARILNFWKVNAPKQKIIYYSNLDIYLNYILPIMGKYYPADRWYLDFDIWVAQWPFFKYLRSPFNNPNLPATMRADWKVYQYTDALNKPTFGSLDGDVFNGPVEDMRKWLGLELPPAPHPDPTPIPVPVPQPAPDPNIPVEHSPWFDGRALYSHFSTVITRSDGVHALDYYIVELYLASFDIVLDSTVAVASTTNFLARKNVQIAINGLDGFFTVKKGRWLVTQLAGFAAWHGFPFDMKKLGQEQTLFISPNNKFSLDRPKTIWNAVSFPNLICKDGQVLSVNKAADDIRARTAFGLNAAQDKACILVVDGKDYYSKDGLNFQETGEILQRLGYGALAVMGDSGGSTTLVRMNDYGKPQIVNRPTGENADGQRSVAIHMGFKLKG